MARSATRRTLEISIPVYESLRARAAQLEVSAAQLAGHLLSEALGASKDGPWHYMAQMAVKTAAEAPRAAVVPKTPDPAVRQAPAVPAAPITPAPAPMKRADRRRQVKPRGQR